jgi:hypothetical protein
MFWVALILIGGFLLFVLVTSAVDGGGRKTYLAMLDLISYLLTSATVVTLVIVTQGQISTVFRDMTGQDLDLGAAREELGLFLATQCGQEPECAEVARAILAIANPRGISKLPSRVDTDVSRLPALAAAVYRYNDAFDQEQARTSIMFLNPGFWVSVVAMCGVIIGLWRRILALKDTIADTRG